jgi:hypothetical protein
MEEQDVFHDQEFGKVGLGDIIVVPISCGEARADQCNGGRLGPKIEGFDRARRGLENS